MKYVESCGSSGPGSPAQGGPQARVSSPVADSTLITRAPRSPSIIAACGPASARVRSRTTRVGQRGVVLVVAHVRQPTVGPRWQGDRHDLGDHLPPGAPERAGRRRPCSTPTSSAWSTTRAARCSCSPAPGTGKTTTLVEAIVDRVERRGADPSQVLALTFSRKAAEQLRDRVTARLGRTTGSAMCSTIHSFAYGLIRRYAPRELYRAPLRLLSAPEQDVVVRELLRRTPESVALARRARPGAGDPRLRARGADGALPRPREGHGGPSTSSPSASASTMPAYVAAGLFLAALPRQPRRPVAPPTTPT